MGCDIARRTRGLAELGPGPKITRRGTGCDPNLERFESVSSPLDDWLLVNWFDLVVVIYIAEISR